MKRRRFFKTLAAAPAASVLLAQQQQKQQPPAPGDQRPRAPGAPAEEPKLETVFSDVGEPVLRFFSAEQFAALRRVSDLLMPPRNGMPGAVDAHAPEFLDFDVGASLPERQEIYRAGLDALNKEARKRYRKAFGEADATEAKALLDPLRQPWTFDLPTEPVARFLVTAKLDVHAATVNSREYISAGNGGGRRAGGQGLYWYPLE